MGYQTPGSHIIDVGLRRKNMYQCNREVVTGLKCCSMKNSFSVQSTAGFQNLKVHRKECIPDDMKVYESRDKEKDIRNFVRVDNKSRNIFRSIEWIVAPKLPFSFVDNELTRVNTASTRTTISRTTLIKYMDQLGYEIEGVLTNILPDCFALAFDGCTPK